MRLGTRQLGIAVLCLWGLVLTAGVADASLVTDTVEMSHCFPTTASIFDGPYNVLVAAGTADRIELTASLNQAPSYGVNVEANSIHIDFVDQITFTAGTNFHGVVIDDLDWISNPAWRVPGVQVASSMGGFDASRVTFGPDWVAVNWHGLAVPNGATFDITLVPEPATMGLLLAGGLALVCRRRRR